MLGSYALDVKCEDCSRCGWNPAVDAERKRNIRRGVIREKERVRLSAARKTAVQDRAGWYYARRALPDPGERVIVTDGVFSMGGDIANLPEICALAQKYGARVMVDDAHGLGVIGEGGRGTASYYGLEDHVDIYMGAFSKSLASRGGYMASSSRVADFVRHSSRPFIFSASIPPANAAAALAALRELEAHPELVTKLQENALYMRGLLNERNIKMRPSNGDRIPIIPIYTYEPIPTLTIA